MAGVIIIASCRVHGFHLVKFRRGQLLKNIPAVQSEKHEQTKDRIHLCLYFTDNEKPTLCMPFFPPYYFTKTAAFSPPPPEHSPPQHCGVRCFFLSFFLFFHLFFFFFAFTNSARAIFVYCYSFLISLAHSLSNQLINRRLNAWSMLMCYILPIFFFLRNKIK